MSKNLLTGPKAACILCEKLGIDVDKMVRFDLEFPFDGACRVVIERVISEDEMEAFATEIARYRLVKEEE